MKIHVLQGLGGGRYRAILHTSMPAGNNSAGVSWKNAYLGAGLNVTVLTTGTGPGQTTDTEKNSILAGDTIEIISELEADTGGTSAASVSAAADSKISEALNALQAKLKYFGYASTS